MSLYTKQSFNQFFNARVIGATILIISGGLLFYGLLSLYVGKNQISETLASVSWPKMGLVVFLILFGWLLRGLRWNYFLGKTGIQISFFKGLHIFLASFALTLTPGKIGELVKGYFLQKENGVPLTKTAGILLTERLLDLAAVLGLSFGFLFFNLKQLFVFFTAFGLIAFLIALVFGGKFYQKVLLRLKNNLLKRALAKIIQLFSQARSLLKPKIIFFSFPLSIFSWACEAAAFYLIAQETGLPISLALGLFVYSMATIAGALSMVPGGFASTEGAMLGLLALEGIKAKTAIPAVVLFRLATVFLIPLLAFFLMLCLLRQPSQPLSKQKP